MPEIKKNNCNKLKKNLKKCIINQTSVRDKDCEFYKKVLHMCLERSKKIFQSGP